MDFSKLLDWIKLSPKYLIPISLVSGLLVFSTENLLLKFGLNEFVNKARPIIGVIFLLSTALILSDILYSIFSLTNKSISHIITTQRLYSRLKKLTPEEKDILYGYLYYNSRTQHFSITDGRLVELIAFNLIYKASNIGDLNNWPYNIQPWAWDYLQKHKSEIFTEEDIKRFGSKYGIDH
ncbi:MAG: hypothetical protein A2X24_12970 [Chloroflexi bacterium GWB2_54_36]|nr:MAG: hypothetical protein A2X24_12970 [Chloroflexi bacterium GWB2_54_36]